MKKILAMLLAVAMVAILMAGCGKTTGSDDTGASDGKVALDVIISQYGNYKSEWWT